MNEKPNNTLLQINKLKSLPALPEASLRIVAAINDPMISTDKLAAVLALSPGVVSRLLGLANSAYFGQAREVTDLPTAVYKVLGLDLVKSLTLGIIMNAQFDPGKCQAFDTRYFWLRSIYTAVAAQRIATVNKISGFSVSSIYTSGLLLYIGMLVLAYLMPAELNVVMMRCKAKGLKIESEVKRCLGFSHFYIGYYLMVKWQLPQIYQSVLKTYTANENQGEVAELVNLLKLSQRLSGMLLDNSEVDIVELEALGKQLVIPTDGLADIIEILLEKRENIESLAEIIGN